MGFFDLGEQEERSFLSVVRHTVLDGPIALVRFSSSTIQEYGAFGKYWMYGAEVLEALENRQVNRLIREIRHRWAISNDWGDLEFCTYPRAASLTHIGVSRSFNLESQQQPRS
jgi:hypothetical protein